MLCRLFFRWWSCSSSCFCSVSQYLWMLCLLFFRWWTCSSSCFCSVSQYLWMLSSLFQMMDLFFFMFLFSISVSMNVVSSLFQMMVLFFFMFLFSISVSMNVVVSFSDDGLVLLHVSVQYLSIYECCRLFFRWWSCSSSCFCSVSQYLWMLSSLFQMMVLFFFMFLFSISVSMNVVSSLFQMMVLFFFMFLFSISVSMNVVSSLFQMMDLFFFMFLFSISVSMNVVSSLFQMMDLFFFMFLFSVSVSMNVVSSLFQMMVLFFFMFLFSISVSMNVVVSFSDDGLVLLHVSVQYLSIYECCLLFFRWWSCSSSCFCSVSQYLWMLSSLFQMMDLFFFMFLFSISVSMNVVFSFSDDGLVLLHVSVQCLSIYECCVVSFSDDGLVLLHVSVQYLSIYECCVFSFSDDGLVLLHVSVQYLSIYECCRLFFRWWTCSSSCFCSVSQYLWMLSSLFQMMDLFFFMFLFSVSVSMNVVFSFSDDGLVLLHVSVQYLSIYECCLLFFRWWSCSSSCFCSVSQYLWMLSSLFQMMVLFFFMFLFSISVSMNVVFSFSDDGLVLLHVSAQYLGGCVRRGQAGDFDSQWRQTELDHPWSRLWALPHHIRQRPHEYRQWAAYYLYKSDQITRWASDIYISFIFSLKKSSFSNNVWTCEDTPAMSYILYTLRRIFKYTINILQNSGLFYYEYCICMY